MMKQKKTTTSKSLQSSPVTPVLVVCPCGYEWMYKGKKKHKIQCPDCLTRIDISQLKSGKKEEE